MLLDVLIANENALEIHPFLLHLQPHLNALRNDIEPALLISDLCAECACVLARGHCLQVGQLILEQQLFLVRVGEDPASVLVAFFVLGQVEVLLLPDLLDLVQLFLVFELLHCLVDDLQHFLFVSL